jgi:hypothetical protein
MAQGVQDDGAVTVLATGLSDRGQTGRRADVPPEYIWLRGLIQTVLVNPLDMKNRTWPSKS